MFLLNLNDQKLTKVGIEDGLDEESVPSSFFIASTTSIFCPW